MRVLVTGAGGQLGHQLTSDLQRERGIQLNALGRSQLDFAQAQHITQTVRELQPEIVINAAAFTAVDAAEDSYQQAYLVNAFAPAVLAAAVRDCNGLLIHFSTEYVFDGTKGAPYAPLDPVNPIGVYGSSKAQGERNIASSGCRYLIFRTSWIYAPHGKNFLLTMLRLFAEREVVRVVADQRGKPTSAAQISRFLFESIIAPRFRGLRTEGESSTYHLAAGKDATWYDFACAILAQGKQLPQLADHWHVRENSSITTSEYPMRAARPANSRLDSGATWSRFGRTLDPWPVALNLCLHQVVRRLDP